MFLQINELARIELPVIAHIFVQGYPVVIFEISNK